MATKTTNYNLTKPSYNESADISVINQNMDIIDEKMKEIDDKAGSGGGGTSVTVDSELSTTSKNPVQNKVVTQALNGKGTYSKPTGGIPKTDLASEVQTSLGKADTALQEHQDISGKADKTEVTAIFNSISDAWNSATAYTEGQYCIHNNMIWKCLVANTNTEPAEGTYWTHTTIDAEIYAVNSNLNDIDKKTTWKFLKISTTKIISDIQKCEELYIMVYPNHSAVCYEFIVPWISIRSGTTLYLNNGYGFGSNNNFVRISHTKSSEKAIIKLEACYENNVSYIDESDIWVYYR